MPTFDGGPEARGKRFAIVASRFNDLIVRSLIDGARSTLEKHGVEKEDIWLVRVPGAFEIPPVARRLSASGRFDGIICLGAVIRGATPHFDYVAGESARGIAAAGLESPVPIVYGVLTTDTVEQATERAGSKAGNRGSDAARAAIEMADLYGQLQQELGKSPGEGP